MSALTILRDGLDELAVIDPDSGELAPLRDASDRALAHAAKLLAEHDSEVLMMKRALAATMRERYGVGKSEAGGYAWTVTEATSWPVGALGDALNSLVATDAISAADVERCFSSKPKPNPVQIKALLGRLMVSDPASARVLAGAATTSPPSLRDIHQVAIDEAA